MKKIILLMCMMSAIVGCTINTAPDSSKNATYTLDSVNAR